MKMSTSFLTDQYLLLKIGEIQAQDFTIQTVFGCKKGINLYEEFWKMCIFTLQVAM